MSSASMQAMQGISPPKKAAEGFFQKTAEGSFQKAAEGSSEKRQGIEQVLRHPAIWRAQQTAQSIQGLSTGHKALDQALPDSGWPAGALTELLVSATGAGELSLLTPALRTICEEGHGQGKGIALLGAPYLPQARAWEQAGIPLERLLVIDAEGNDLLWAAEQVLRSGECGAVLVWSAAAGRALNHRALQRLHLAASTGNALCFLYRPFAAETSPSPAPLRLRLAAQAGDLHVQIVKGRGAPRVKAVPVKLFPAHWNGFLSEVLPSAAGSFAASGTLAAPAPAEAAKVPPRPLQLSLV